MAGLTRYLQTIFGSSAANGRMSEFGSLQAGSPATYSGSTITPDLVQALSNYESGMDGSVIGNGSPPIQDHNSLFYLFSYQLAYLMERGIPEYLSTQTYNTNDLCQSGGIVYQSLIDANTGHTPSSNPSDWAIFSYKRTAPAITVYQSGSGTYSVPAGCLYLRIKMIGGGGGGAGLSNPGTAGNDTTFHAASGLSITCSGGSAGSTNDGGAGGGVTTTGSGTNGIFQGVGLTGGQGASVGSGVGTTGIFIAGGNGAASPFGGEGGGGAPSANGGNASANTGSGGGGYGGNTSTNSNGGGGGGAGGFLEGIILSPTSSYSYSVGASAAGGTGTVTGGAGSAGIIVVEAVFN